MIYKYCFYYIITSIRKSSPIYLIRAHESRRKYVWRYLWITFFLGPWGIPKGIVYTLECLRNQLEGGTDLTEEIMNYLS
ncbi:hypothetical protein [Fusibacter sp. 3D3]|uniref:hypothetical protein n=1 Tax=Fusibacter sp. 3D3 TaxID=1048380 RepID=UPI001112CC16|nr:hypothetical protein [Fusibacter sp. 3D3]